MKNDFTTAPIPTEIKLLTAKKTLIITFEDGQRFELPSEYLRVYSPSAEVRGHGRSSNDQPAHLEVGKQDVKILSVEPVGQYAVKLVFDDGHNTGLYSFETLYSLGVHYERNWQAYCARLAAERH